MRNRRMNRRIDVAGKMVATITYSDNLKSIKKGVVSNISRQGMYMDTDIVLDKDAYVNLKIDAKDLLGKPLWVQGVVVRTDDSGMGIQFTYTDYEDITNLFSN